MELKLHHNHYTFVKYFSLKTIWILKVFVVFFFNIYFVYVCEYLEVRAASERFLLPHGSLGLKWEHQALGEVLLSTDSSSLALKKDSLYFYVFACCVCMHMCTHVWGCLKRSEGGVDPLELELQAVVSGPMWEWGMKLGTSGRPVSMLKHWISIIILWLTIKGAEQHLGDPPLSPGSLCPFFSKELWLLFPDYIILVKVTS